jgi:RNA polymerase sigma factor (sigma-70 family)
MSASDAELIQAYTTQGSQSAFADLVHRYVDLVYTAARRQVWSQDLAEEVTQSAFLALAHNLDKLDPNRPLAAWLIVVTRRTAIDVGRRESRRRNREQALAQVGPMNSNSEWVQVEPLLDEALESLTEPDRTAILARFFENKSLREVGGLIGTSEDAAQKRVGRALDELRAFFSRRGITVGAAALAADLTAGAVQSAPVGLSLTITSTAAVTATVAVTTASVGNAITMTTVQKVLVGTAAAFLVGIGVYEQRVISRQNAELSAIREQTARLDAANRKLRQDRADDLQLLAQVQAAVESARTGTAPGTLPARGDPVIEAELKAVFERVTVLKDRLARSPAEHIPELRLLTDQDWINTAADHKLETDDNVSTAFGALRSKAKGRLGGLMSKALGKYFEANQGQLPSDILLLAPHLAPPVSSDMLQRYAVVTTASEAAAISGQLVIADIAPADAKRDSRLYLNGPVTKNGASSLSLGSDHFSDASSPVLGALGRFAKANPGAQPTEIAQLLPYLSSPVPTPKLEEFWQALGLPKQLHRPSK